MNYLMHMKHILLPDSRTYQEIYDKNLSLRYCITNVFIFGLIYGVSVMHFSRDVLNSLSQHPDSVVYSKLMILMAGISVAFLIHGAGTLFVWVFCRGMGGRNNFMILYLNLGVGAISLWPIAPAIAAYHADFSGLFFFAYLTISILYGAAVLFISIKAASNLSRIKTVIVSVVTVMYTTCFLYLWV